MVGFAKLRGCAVVWVALLRLVVFVSTTEQRRKGRVRESEREMAPLRMIGVSMTMSDTRM